ncbi:hypothetical protein LQZ19_06520 [Treponema primitia]|uniref:hypothetical protein n=1 Tax=Treponema primitia TaxID=88058 RepID=UPI00397FC500
MTFIRRLVLTLLFILPGVLFGNDLEDSRRTMLTGILKERKIPFELRSLFTEYGGFGSSIHVSLPASDNGEGKKSGTFILAVPLSFTGDDRRDFPYAFEVALGFMDRILKTGSKTDILVAFLGDERSAPPNLGLRDLYSRLEVPEDTALIYLDMYGEIAEMVIHHGARRELAPMNILEPLGRLCDSRAIPYTLGISSNEIYKLALADGPPALEFALSRGLPALYLTGSNTASGGSEVPRIDLDTLLFEYAPSIDIGTENPDYHYLIFQFAGKTFFIPEYTTVIFFLAIATLLFLAILIYSVVFRFRLVVQWKVFLKRSWILLLYYILLVLSLKGAALTFQFLSGAKRFAPGTGLFYGTTAAQILLGIALFTFISPLGNLIYVPRRANFYGNASVILVSLEILLAAFFDITFIPIFLWIFVFTFMAACIKQPLLVWLCSFLAFFRGFSTLLTVVLGGNRRLGSLILSGNTAIILYIALISLPFFITLKRGTLLLPVRDKKTSPGRLKRLVPMIPRLAFLVFTVVILGISVSFFTRYPVKQPVQRIQDDGAGNTNFLGMDVKDRILLERRTLDITLKAPGKPLRFNLYLDSALANEIPVIYAAPMPVRNIEDGDSSNRNSIEFVLGDGPPNPFITEIVVPLDFSGFLRAEALYPEQPGEDFQLRIIHRYPIGLP